jgi:hypothetical protein
VSRKKCSTEIILERIRTSNKRLYGHEDRHQAFLNALEDMPVMER